MSWEQDGLQIIRLESKGYEQKTHKIKLIAAT